MMAKNISGKGSPFRVIDISVKRNAFGRQVDSFGPVYIPVLGDIFSCGVHPRAGHRALREGCEFLHA
jgi:glutamine amidotransferase PdxT